MHTFPDIDFNPTGFSKGKAGNGVQKNWINFKIFKHDLQVRKVWKKINLDNSTPKKGDNCCWH